MAASVAPSTASTYQAGVDNYLHFCKQIGKPPFPVTENRLMYFVASTRHRLGFKTIKVYLAAIQYRSATLGWPLIIASMIRLHYALRGIRRLQGPEFTRPLRSPITTHHLRILRHHFMNYVSQRSDGYMLTTAALLAFLGLLRASEYLSESSNHFDKLCNLQCCHISLAPDLTYMKINIH